VAINRLFLRLAVSRLTAKVIVRIRFNYVASWSPITFQIIISRFRLSFVFTWIRVLIRVWMIFTTGRCDGSCDRGFSAPALNDGPCRCMLRSATNVSTATYYTVIVCLQHRSWAGNHYTLSFMRSEPNMPYKLPLPFKHYLVVESPTLHETVTKSSNSMTRRARKQWTPLLYACLQSKCTCNINRESKKVTLTTESYPCRKMYKYMYQLGQRCLQHLSIFLSIPA